MTTLVRTDGDQLRYNWEIIVRQGEVWIDRQGNEHRIAEIDPGYRANIFAFVVQHHGRRLLRREIERYLLMEGSPVGLRGDEACQAFDDEFDALIAMSPEEYIRSTPLGRALGAQ